MISKFKIQRFRVRLAKMNKIILSRIKMTKDVKILKINSNIN